MTAPGGPQQAFDKRLLRFGRPVHSYLAAIAALGMMAAAAAIAQTLLLGLVIAEVFHGARLDEVEAALWWLLIVAALRGLIGWVTEVVAHRSAATTKSALRTALMGHVVTNRGAGADPGATAAAAGRGIEALDAYFGRYLPQVVLAAAVPLMVIGTMAALDPWSAVIVAVTIPLVPVFAALTGAATRSRVRRRWQVFSDLSSAFVEAVRSLPTLKVFGRSREAVVRFGRIAEAHRVETMATLRIAFLSALTLELAATISIAVVAVAVGLRVLGAGLELQPAITVLILAPEAYLPLRRLAADFHSAAEGVEAAGRILDALDAPAARASFGTRVPPARPCIALLDVRVGYPGRSEPVLDGLSLEIGPDDYLAVVGPSGSGKSTVLSTILGFTGAESGMVTVDGVPIAEFDAALWLQRIGWLPQTPHLFAGTIADNVRLGRPGASDDLVERALVDAGAGFVGDLVDGAATVIGERGAGLSAGQLSRLALARALIRRAPILLLDEPTAHLDPITELSILDTLDGLRGSCAIVVATHRMAVAGRADRVLHLQPVVPAGPWSP